MAGEKLLHVARAQFGAAGAALDVLKFLAHERIEARRLVERIREPGAHGVQFAAHGLRDRHDLRACGFLRGGQADRGARQRLSHEVHFLAAPDDIGDEPDEGERQKRGGGERAYFGAGQGGESGEAVKTPSIGENRAEGEEARNGSGRRDAPARTARDHAIENAACRRVLIGGANRQFHDGGARRGFLRHFRCQIQVFHNVFPAPVQSGQGVG